MEKSLTWMEGATQYAVRYSAIYHKAAATRTRHRQIARDFGEVVGDKPLGEISLEDVERYVARRVEGRSAWTVYGELVKLRSMWRWLKKRQFVRRSPMKGLPRFRRPRVDPRAPALEVVRRLRAWLGEHGHKFQLQLLLLVLSIGLRVREMLALRVDDVSLEDRALSVRNIKPPYAVKVIRLNDDAYEVLKERIDQVGDGLLFRSRTGRELLRWNVSKRFRTLAKRAGATTVTLHNLRKLFASQNGRKYPERMLMQITRHDTSESVSHYCQIDETPMPVLIR